MKWQYRLSPDAFADLTALDGSQQKQVLKALDKLVLNPLPQAEGGYGSPLGNKGGVDLTGFLKIKLRGAGLRIVYKLVKIDGAAYVIIIGARESEQVYREAKRRMEAFEYWYDSL
jgi:mRNA interferase RelE/StbE